MPKKYEVAQLDEIPAGTHKVVKVKNRELGIFNIDGALYALPNLCPHQMGPLCTGKVSGTLEKDQTTNWQLNWKKEGEIVTCPWHGLEYHIKTGQCLAFPKTKLKSYEASVENGTVVVML